MSLSPHRSETHARFPATDFRQCPKFRLQREKERKRERDAYSTYVHVAVNALVKVARGEFNNWNGREGTTGLTVVSVTSGCTRTLPQARHEDAGRVMSLRRKSRQHLPWFGCSVIPKERRDVRRAIYVLIVGALIGAMARRTRLFSACR